MKYSLLLLFHALLAGVTSLFTLFIFQTMVRKLFMSSEMITADEMVTEESEVVVRRKTYSPVAFSLNLIHAMIPALSFLFPLSIVVVSTEPAEYASLVLLAAVLFIGMGILIAEKTGSFRAKNPYPPSKGKDEDH